MGRAVYHCRRIGVGCMAHGISLWSNGRKPLSPELRMHSQNARDNKLTAEIGERYHSLSGGAVLGHATDEG
jgi:sugar (pentulose or hexulose) kinase